MGVTQKMRLVIMDKNYSPPVVIYSDEINSPSINLYMWVSSCSTRVLAKYIVCSSNIDCLVL